MRTWTVSARRLASDVHVVSLNAGFYFAVQSGGTFEIDYVVMDPDDKVLLEGQNERQGDYIFTANKVRTALHEPPNERLASTAFASRTRRP